MKMVTMVNVVLCRFYCWGEKSTRQSFLRTFSLDFKKVCSFVDPVVNKRNSRTDITDFLQADVNLSFFTSSPSAGVSWREANGVSLTRFPQGPPALQGNPSAPPASDQECSGKVGVSGEKHRRTQQGAKRKCQHCFPCLFLPS